METQDRPEVPDKWTVFSINTRDTARDLDISYYLAKKYGLIAVGILGSGMMITVRIDENGKEICPKEGCNEALQKLIDEGVCITF